MVSQAMLPQFLPIPLNPEHLERKRHKEPFSWSRGVDHRVFDPALRDHTLRDSWGARNKTVLLYVGRLAREKNVDILFEAYQRLNNEIRLKTRLVIIGGGAQEEYLRSIAPEGTIFTGKLSGRDLSVAYASGDIFTFTSATETFGNVLLEAAASGLPLISPRAAV